MKLCCVTISWQTAIVDIVSNSIKFPSLSSFIDQSVVSTVLLLLIYNS